MSTTSPHQPDLSVVLPAHNEVRLLASTLSSVDGALAERGIAYEILVVENGSTDGTLRLARTLAAQLPSLRVLALPRANYGAALRTGFEAALGTIVVNFDVDYFDLGFLDGATKLLDQGADMVLASKRTAGARDRRPLIRRVLTAGFATSLRWLLQLEITDAHGMKAMRRERVAPLVDLSTMTGSLFDVEVVARALRQQFSVIELPVNVVELRPPRTSTLRRAVETIFGLVRLRFALRPIRSKLH